MEISNSHARAVRGLDPDAAAGRDAKQLLEPLMRRWYVVLSVAFLTAAASFFYFRQQEPTYTASTSVFLQPSSLDSSLTPAPPGTDPDRSATNQARLARTPAAAELAARRLHFDGDPRALLPLVQAIPDPDSDFLTIEATASDPKRAATVANAFAEGYVQLGTGRIREEATKTRAAIESELAKLTPTRENRTLRRSLQDRLQRVTLILTVPPQGARQVDRATPPAQAAGASPTRNAIFAGMLGLILGALLAHGIEALQRRLPSSHAEEAYGLPLLASIPFNRKAAAEAQQGPGLPAAMVEPVRTLRTALDHGSIGGPRPRTILVTSAIEGEGKSTLTKCLALGFFQGGRKVLLIDGDLRRPRLHEFFDIEPEPGLSDVLRSGEPLAQGVRRILLDGGIESAVEAPVVTFEPNYGAIEPVAGLGLGSDDEATAVAPRSRSETRSDKGSWRGAKARSQNGAKRSDLLVDLLPALDLLPSGSRVSDPGALLGTEQMSTVLAEAADSYDVVLIDSSPLLAVSDAIPLATEVDGVVVVTRPDLTTRDEAEGVRRVLERLPQITVLGLVANGVRAPARARQDRYTSPALPTWASP